MAQFAHLAQEVVESAHYSMAWATGNSESYLIVRFAGEKNEKYFNAKLKVVGQQMRRKAQLDVSMVRKDRMDDRQLFTEHVIIGWNKIPDANGNDAEFNKENCANFINQALADDEEFDLLRAFCKDYSNFRKIRDSGSLVGNSSTV